jgi:hypothetical protein
MNKHNFCTGAFPERFYKKCRDPFLGKTGVADVMNDYTVFNLLTFVSYVKRMGPIMGKDPSQFIK